ncbi:MAG: hypothetical protein R3C10_25345 [Pirellulales bacterium]|nr:hypothetical protein [Planctomycetales bacterium]
MNLASHHIEGVATDRASGSMDETAEVHALPSFVRTDEVIYLRLTTGKSDGKPVAGA